SHANGVRARFLPTSVKHGGALTGPRRMVCPFQISGDNDHVVNSIPRLSNNAGDQDKCKDSQQRGSSLSARHSLLPCSHVLVTVCPTRYYSLVASTHDIAKSN